MLQHVTQSKPLPRKQLIIVLFLTFRFRAADASRYYLSIYSTTYPQIRIVNRDPFSRVNCLWECHAESLRHVTGVIRSDGNNFFRDPILLRHCCEAVSNIAGSVSSCKIMSMSKICNIFRIPWKYYYLTITNTGVHIACVSKLLFLVDSGKEAYHILALFSGQHSESFANTSYYKFMYFGTI